MDLYFLFQLSTGTEPFFTACFHHFHHNILPIIYSLLRHVSEGLGEVLLAERQLAGGPDLSVLQLVSVDIREGICTLYLQA